MMLRALSIVLGAGCVSGAVGGRVLAAEPGTAGRGGPTLEVLARPDGAVISADVRGVSADGGAILILATLRGKGTSYSYHAMAWREGERYTDLGPLEGYPHAFGQAMSADGMAVLGTSNDAGFSTLEGCVWRDTRDGWGEAIPLTPLPGGVVRSVGGVSADGSAIVGSVQTNDGESAFRWTSAGGYELLGVLAGDSFSQADDVSDDGRVVVGSSFTEATGRPYRWTAEEGMQELGALAGYPWITAPFAANANGSVVVGVAMNNDPPSARAFRWTQKDGMVGVDAVGTLASSTFTLLCDVSGDGSLGVGYATLGWAQTAAIWVEGAGLVELLPYLAARGVDVEGWSMDTARAVSTDGTTIVGSGRYQDQNVMWVVSGLPCRFACPLVCDSLDFNNDTITPDSGDLDDFLAVLGGGPSACSTFPTPGCNDLDFNNDGLFPDSADLEAFVRRLGGGPC